MTATAPESSAAAIEFAPAPSATAISTARTSTSVRDAAAASTSPSSISSHYHRGDPLDIPLIDHYLLTQLLFPRLVSAIQLAFPQVYLDWTTASSSITPNNSNYKTLRWKRIVEGILRACLLVGSCRRIIVRHQASSQHQKQPYRDREEVSVITPAMHSLGMQIRPVSSTFRGNSINKNRSSGVINLLQQFTKVGTLILATVILPSIYKELKLYRKRQLEEHDRQLRLDDIRREEHQLFHSLSSSSSSSATDNPRHPREANLHRNNSSSSIIQQRAQKRQSHLLTYLIDTTIGMGEVFLPPLQLVNYVMYLWGRSCTPQLGMLFAGWEYCNLDIISADANHDDGGGGIGEASHHHHRHVNFQYAHRRLVVEEGLRAVSMILPPALPSHLRIGDGNVGGNSSTAATVVENNHRTAGEVGAVAEGRRHGTGSDSTERAVDDDVTSRRRSGWTMMRKKILSFMGVIDEEDANNPTSATAAPTSSTSEARRYSLTCSMCNMENPSIPYIASCGHCYCYLCLRMAVTDNLSFRCTDCGSMIVSSARPKVETFVR
ncbi:hypothetical protein ACHAXH_005363 [Discostella pseudostelligera]